MVTNRVDHVTCLGCGCGCDDITVTVAEGRIAEIAPACPVARTWFGDGSVPQQVLRSGHPASFDEAISAAAKLLTGARGRALVYLGPDLTAEAQRLAVGLADSLAATVDSATSAPAAAGLLAAQRRGRVAATLGEIRNRADVVMFWGVDPSQRYPRFMARHVEPAGTHVPEGRAGRTIISVSVGSDRGVRSADIELELGVKDELTALSLMRALLQGRSIGSSSPWFEQVSTVTERLAKARYAVLVHDAEPAAEPRDPLRVEALIALAQALNAPTRAAVCSLRSGGNRPGAESVLTWQSGFPFSVDYSQGHPRYHPGRRGLDRLAAGAFRATLFLGSPPDGTVASALRGVAAVAIGPHASRAPFTAEVAIDTGVAGIHESGTGYRMDEVPLRLRPPLSGPRSTAETLRALIQAVGTTPVEPRR